MKKLNKIRLASFAEEELGKRELGKVLGGENCCICSCDPNVSWGTIKGPSNSNYANNSDDGVGYGSGAYTPPHTI